MNSATNMGRMNNESFTAICNHTGKVLGTAATVQSAMDRADVAKPRGGVTVRGEYTSDGTHWGPGQGRVLATREDTRWLVG